MEIVKKLREANKGEEEITLKLENLEKEIEELKRSRELVLRERIKQLENSLEVYERDGGDAP
jgi:F0F1-type ATP synthase membrane subunit b/b'